MINVAVFPAGTEIGLEIHASIKYSKGINLIGFASIEDHSSFIYRNCDFTAPFVDSHLLLQQLNQLLEKYQVDYLFPAHDEVVYRLSKYRKQLKAVLVAPRDELCEISRYKSKTYDALDGEKFLPETIDISNIEETNFPLFAKPDSGQGSKGVFKLESKNDLKSIRNPEKYIYCEYLPGDEYTVDCLSNSDGNLIYASPRTRARVKSGISVSSKIEPDAKEFTKIAERISDRLHIEGGWFFQVKRNSKGKLKLLEISARIAGTMGLTRARGVNIPLLSLFIKMNLPVVANSNNGLLQVDRAFISRYKDSFDYKYIYIDFDDTITFGERVNPMMMAFLYQSRNQGKEIILLTRHVGNITETLNKLKIAENLFHEIAHLPQDKLVRKSEYTVKKPFIFIDDSFSERNDVSITHSVATFDLDCVEMLLDWRM